MTNDRTIEAMTRLNNLLDTEREALLCGDITKLAGMADDKERLIETLSDARDAAPDALRVLDDKVKRNQLLLDGALDGIRAVSRRLAALRRVRMSLDTYDARGAKKEIDVATAPTVERRA